jgi:hypothetical protein
MGTNMANKKNTISNATAPVTNNHMGSGIVKYQTAATGLTTTFNSESAVTSNQMKGVNSSVNNTEPNMLYSNAKIVDTNITNSGLNSIPMR